MSRAFRLGLFIVGSLVIFAIAVFLIGGQESRFRPTYRLKAQFQNVSGLIDGAEVRVGGIHKGTVRSIQLPHRPDQKLTVVMDLESSTRDVIKKDSVASIKSEGLLGDKYLEISFGSPDVDRVRDGDMIETAPPLDISELITKTNQILDSAKDTIQNVDSISTKVNNGQGSIGALINDKKVYEQVNAATAEAQEDMEALKHNFFLRGFFKHRGFYSLQQMSAEEYRKSDFVKEKKSIRDWLPANELFRRTKSGVELTEQGRHALDQAMANILPHLPNKPLMIEGYSSEGPEAERYRESEARATAVRDYLMSRFQLKPEFTGTMPLSDHPPEQTGKTTWDGICLVLVT